MRVTCHGDKLGAAQILHLILGQRQQQIQRVKQVMSVDDILAESFVNELVARNDRLVT